jgi:protein-tyrosine phosphatase
VDARVHSAGLLFADRPASPDAVAVMADQGIDIAGHRSRKIGADLVVAADLVLGLTREHVREVALLAPDALAKTFTLKELIWRGDDAGPRPAGEALPAWLDRIAAGRTRGDILGASDVDDVDDPIGRPRNFYEETRAELVGLVDRLVALVFAADAADAPARESA